MNKNKSNNYKKRRVRKKPAPKQERPDGAVRINKAIASTGFVSRREADQLVADGKVTIDGKKAAMGDFVFADQSIAVNGRELVRKVKKVYLVLNKPEGIECTTDRNVADNIIDFIAYNKRIFPVGRLDKGSEGLILLTNDGDIVNPILRAQNAHEKEYIVTVNKSITSEFLQKMSSGVRILRQKTLPAKVTKIDDKTFKIVLVQGLNRQIRRMTETLGYKVVKLKRIRIMNIKIGNLKTGTYRALTAKEKEELHRLLNK